MLCYAMLPIHGIILIHDSGHSPRFSFFYDEIFILSSFAISSIIIIVVRMTDDEFDFYFFSLQPSEPFPFPCFASVFPFFRKKLA